MKTFTIYKAKSGLFFSEFTIKGESKKRRMPINGSIQDAYSRFLKNGYSFIDPYQQNIF